jgi:short-chain fatty acids transporter
MFVYWMGYSVSEEFRFGLNEVNFILFYVGLVLHGGLSQYMATVKKACFRLAPILVQYPIYAGIMGIMIQSGLAVEISDLFVSFSSAKTYPVYMFLSSGLVNLFVPSGGGQWAVQAPVVIQGAQALGVPLWKVVLAVAWGDAWTNLAQPFWALPLLSIVGLSIRDILGYCLQALFVSGLVISLFFWLA